MRLEETDSYMNLLLASNFHFRPQRPLFRVIILDKKARTFCLETCSDDTFYAEIIKNMPVDRLSYDRKTQNKGKLGVLGL